MMPITSPPLPPRDPPAPLRLCVVRDGRFSVAEAEYDVVTGDTTVSGRPFAGVYPTTAEYASAAPWYVNNEPIVFRGRRYLEYGLPRVLAPADVKLVGTANGVAVFAETLGDAPYVVLYLPISPPCLFQVYQVGEVGGAVRG